MGIQDFTAIFNNLDTACKGYITAPQVIELQKSIHFSSIPVEHVEAAISHVCGSSGQVFREQFMDVLDEIERRRSTDEQAYWDFQALDYNGTNRISLRDALLLFREFHGNRFSLHTWRKFLESREVPNADVYFNEIRKWLCDYPHGEPATSDQIAKEERRLEGLQNKYETDEYDSYKHLQEDEGEFHDYQDYTQHSSHRKLNKWKKQGLEAMLFDDGLEGDDTELPAQPKDQVSMSDLMESLDTKYEILREKLLTEMARLSSAMEGDQPEILHQLSKQERQFRRNGNLKDRVYELAGARTPLTLTLVGMMGEVRTADAKRKEAVELKIQELQTAGHLESEIYKIIHNEYKEMTDGDTSCGAVLLSLHRRFKEEKEAMLSIMKSKGGQGATVRESSRLYRQHLLLKEDGDFQSAAMATGLGERHQQYKSNRFADWDRYRSEKLSQSRLLEKKGRKQHRTPNDALDMNSLDEMGEYAVQRQIVTELVKKHLFEREALIYMLQGRDSASSKAEAKSMSNDLRNKQLKALRNQHTTWKGSGSADISILHRTLQEAVGFYYENRKCDLQAMIDPKIAEDEVNACILADLQQRQEVEFEMLSEELYLKSKEELGNLVLKENKARLQEHYNNIAYVVLGTLEVTKDEEEYVEALNEKYEALREKVFIMGLRDSMGVDWKRMSEKEKRKEIKECKKKEKILRGQGAYEELEGLAGPKSKAKMLPPLRKLIGEEKGEFEVRFAKQRSSGHIEDERRTGSFDPINILADLVHRYDSEQETLLMWLKKKETKSLPTKVRRLKILQLKLETFASKSEEDFEVAAYFVGLLERIIAALHGRHPEDNKRQNELAGRRTYIRNRRLMQNEAYEKKMDMLPDPETGTGDLSGWQIAYLREVLLRHDDEREALLQYLQDDSMEELKEAADMMSDDEKKTRLAELHDKRRRLDLTNKDDQDENIFILEESVAIRSVCKRREMEKQVRRQVPKQDVTTALLQELQEEQDLEIATILENIIDLSEDELRTHKSSEKEMRSQSQLNNVFIVLTQSEGKAHEKELLNALLAKYETLEENLIATSLQHKLGTKEWTSLSEKEQVHKVISCKKRISELRTAGDNVGLIEILGGLKLEKTVGGSMGMPRGEFLHLVNDSQEDDLLTEPEEEVQNMNSPLSDLWNRFEREKKDIMHKLKGLQDEYMSDVDQQVHLVRLFREKILAGGTMTFALTSAMVGLSERQQVTGKPRLTGDRGRYEKLAQQKIQDGITRKKAREFKDQIARGLDKVELMSSLMESYNYKHLSEQDFFSRLLSAPADQQLVHGVQVLSQQQRKDRLVQLKQNREATPHERQSDHEKIFLEGLVIRREICRHRMNGEQKAEVSSEQVNLSLMADLLLSQNCEVEKLLQVFADKTIEEFESLQTQTISSRKFNVGENIASVIFSAETTLDGSSDTDVVEALDGKYDALRDKLLVEALIKQYGDSEWKRMSELERQKKIMELKLKERKLRREGKMDELAQILGDALDDQETLKRLMGESREEQERKMRERLARRKQRLAQGMSEEECNELEEEEIAAEEREEKKRRKNILLELEHRYDKEKEDLLKQIESGGDHMSKEQARQLQLMKLRREERKARNEDKFDSAALVLGLAEENEKSRSKMTEEERKRQERLAKERIEAARRRRREGKESLEEDINTDTDDVLLLQESLIMALDKRHRHERDLLINLLDEASDSEARSRAKEMSESERQDKLTELQELRKMWRKSDHKDPNEQMKILQEAASFLLESELHKCKENGTAKSDDDIKVQILSGLQQWQDAEAKMTLSNLDNKNAASLQQMVKLQLMVEEEGFHDNVSHVLLGKSSQGEDTNDEDDEVVAALEQKYDVLKEKLLEATLIQEMGEDEWNKLSDKDKQKRIVDLKLKEKKLRDEGRTEEAAALFEKLLENDEVLNKILGDEPEDENKRLEERQKRKEELIKEREEKGLPTDDDSLEEILNQEEKERGKQRRRNVLENLDMMLEDEKARLLASLKSQVDGLEKERERQIAIARLKHEEKRLKREEKLESAALIVSMAREQQEQHEKNFLEERERQKALAKERLMARRKKLQDKRAPQNLEDKLKAEEEAESLEDLKNSNSDEVSSTQMSIMEAVDQRQQEERNKLMDLMESARSNASLMKSVRKMSPQELKTQLTKLELDQKNWRQKSQKMSLDVDDSKLSKKEKEKQWKSVADRRNEQTKLLSEAMAHRIGLEEQRNRDKDVSLSPEEMMEELSVSLLADLQERQKSENGVIQRLIQTQDIKGLKRMKAIHRAAKREGWCDNLTAMLFKLSDSDDGDEVGLQILKKMETDLEDELKKEKDDFEEKARQNNMSEEDYQTALKELEMQQQQKRRVMAENLESQRQKILERVASRKFESLEREKSEIASVQLVMLADNQQKQRKEAVEKEKSQQANELQKRLEARRQARKRAQEQAVEKPPLTDEERFSDSRPSTTDSNPFSSLKREKTALDVTVTDQEKNTALDKIYREHKTLQSRIQDQQKMQEEMLRRQLEKRKGKRDLEAHQLVSLGERQKTTLLKSQEDEKTRQMMAIQSKVRGRSRSPGVRAKSIPEENEADGGKKSAMKKS